MRIFGKKTMRTILYFLLFIINLSIFPYFELDILDLIILFLPYQC